MSVEEFKQHTVRKVESIRCPDHRQPPRVKFSGTTLRDVTIQMSGCCSKLLELANKAIANRAIADRQVIPQAQRPDL